MAGLAHKRAHPNAFPMLSLLFRQEADPIERGGRISESKDRWAAQRGDQCFTIGQPWLVYDDHG